MIEDLIERMAALLYLDACPVRSFARPIRQANPESAFRPARKAARAVPAAR